MHQAAEIGSTQTPSLAISHGDLQLEGEIASRATCSVVRGRYRGEYVAVKKAKIGSTRDLEFFRREVALLMRLRHLNITALKGARLLPPGALILLSMWAKWR